MRFTRPGISESALAAHFEYLCSLSGSQRLAYVPVVASGWVTSFECTTLRFWICSAGQMHSSYTIHRTIKLYKMVRWFWWTLDANISKPFRWVRFATLTSLKRLRVWYQWVLLILLPLLCYPYLVKLAHIQPMVPLPLRKRNYIAQCCLRRRLLWVYARRQRDWVYMICIENLVTSSDRSWNR